MDGTLLARRSIDAICEAFGLEGRLASLDREVQGLPAFRVAERVARLLAGLRVDSLLEVFDQIPLNPGVRELLAHFRRAGYVTALATDSYRLLARRLALKLGIDLVYGHELEVRAGLITGRLLTPYQCLEIPGCSRYHTCKLRFLEWGRRVFGGPVVTVGDGDSDYCMSRAADLAIAYRGKGPRIRRAAALLVDDYHELLRVLPARLPYKGADVS